MVGRSKLDHGLIRDLASLLDETGLTEIEWSEGIRRIRVSRQNHAAPTFMAAPGHYSAPPMPAPAINASATPVVIEDDPAKHPGAVKSPMVGTAYLSPKPGEPAFVSIGQMVSEGQTLMVIEAMKTFNPIPAPKAGKLVRILAQDTRPVEFGEVLMIVE